MGAKNALLAFGDIRTALRSTSAGQAEADALVRRVHPDVVVEPVGETDLFSATNPPHGTVYAAAFADAELLCDWTVIVDTPELPEHLVELAAGRRIAMHAMHSSVDALMFGLWEDGRAVRLVSMSPEEGVVTDFGEPLDFEVPFWAGEHPVDTGGWSGAEPYPLPFHPLSLGEEALRALFGFVMEGFPQPDDIDTMAVRVHGFRISGG